MPHDPTPSPHRRRHLALALCAGPLLIASPLLLEGFRDPATIIARWDMWLIFIILPFAAAAILLCHGSRPRNGTRPHDSGG